MSEQHLCDPTHCQSHEYVVKTMDRLENITAELTRGQTQIIGVIKDISRLSSRVEKLETNQDEIKKFMYKIAGVVAAVGFAAPLIISMIQQF